MNPSDSQPRAKRSWWYIISPCVIVAVLSLLPIIMGLNEGGYGLIAAMILVPFLIIIIIADLLIKYLLKRKTLLIWLIEILLIAGMIALLVYYSDKSLSGINFPR